MSAEKGGMKQREDGEARGERRLRSPLHRVLSSQRNEDSAYSLNMSWRNLGRSQVLPSQLFPGQKKPANTMNS